MSTGTRIAQLRTERQWSQTRLAQKVGVNVKSVKDWENDTSLPTINSVKKLCTLFHTSADYLLEMDDRPVVVLNQLSSEEAIRARQLLQVFMDTSPRL